MWNDFLQWVPSLFARTPRHMPSSPTWPPGGTLSSHLFPSSFGLLQLSGHLLCCLPPLCPLPLILGRSPQSQVTPQTPSLPEFFPGQLLLRAVDGRQRKEEEFDLLAAHTHTHARTHARDLAPLPILSPELAFCLALGTPLLCLAPHWAVPDPNLPFSLGHALASGQRVTLDKVPSHSTVAILGKKELMAGHERAPLDPSTIQGRSRASPSKDIRKGHAEALRSLLTC
jgi:hypothetical protein